MGNITIIGMGPGDPELITVKANKAIEAATVIVGGRRHLDTIDCEGKRTFEITGRLVEAADFIHTASVTEDVAVLVSGDPCFYSFSDYLQRKIPDTIISIIPGIGSLQYFFSRLGRSWSEAYLSSIHGRGMDILAAYNKHAIVALLTGSTMGPADIASQLDDLGHGDAVLTVGENLSYDNERIVTGMAREMRDSAFEPLCVVVIEHG